MSDSVSRKPKLSPGRLDGLRKKVLDACEELQAAPSMGKQRVQDKIFQFLREMFKDPRGVELAYELTPALVSSGIFTGGGWHHEDRLLPSLVRGSLLTNGLFPSIEALSELRMLAIAEEKVPSQALSSEEAKEFLLEVLALNLDILFEHSTEESRTMPYQHALGHYLFQFIAMKIDLTHLFNIYLSELEALSHQRPIVTKQVRKTIQSGIEFLTKSEGVGDNKDRQRFQLFYKACFQPTPLSEQSGDIPNYRSAVIEASEDTLAEEAGIYGRYLLQCGLSSPYHSVFLRLIAKQSPDLIPVCLNLNEHGKVEFERHRDFVIQLIRLCIRPATPEYIYGFGRFLERNLLSQKEVVKGIEKLVELNVQPEVKAALMNSRSDSEGVTPNALLICGLLSVLGQPLGIGQGRNPTCQAARGISLWSQHDPGYLIETVLSVVRSGQISISFEGLDLSSAMLFKLEAERYLDTSVDPISQILSPHIDVLYAEILKRVYGRGADGHKWANPALYGRWIHKGFDSVLDPSQTVVHNYKNFLRRFYATHHREFNENTPITYANPVGIFVTNAHGDLIGLHAVSIQRVKKDESDQVRVYFFNPNNEGRQDWGQGIVPEVFGHGERYGESSLPFHHFASRLYAFHFNPYEEGDGFAVPNETISTVVVLAKSSWGRAYQWLN